MSHKNYRQFKKFGIVFVEQIGLVIVAFLS